MYGRLVREETIRWRLRWIAAADLEWAFALHRDALGEYVAKTWGWEESTQRQMFCESFAHRPRQVIEVEGDRVGVIELDDRPQELYLANLELAARWQGRGLGAEILRWLLACAERAHKPLSLHVLRANPRATRFYEREGLRIVAAEPTKLLMRSSSR